jgi:hypothetical protein
MLAKYKLVIAFSKICGHKNPLRGKTNEGVYG